MVEGVNSGVKSGSHLWGEAGSLLHAEGAQGPAKQEGPAVPLPIWRKEWAGMELPIVNLGWEERGDQ